MTALAAVVGVVAGCGGGDKPPAYANVSGSVTYNSQPIEKGQITFSTDGRPPSVADIIDGKFTGQAMIGSNKVMVAAYRKSTKERSLPPTAKAQIEAYAGMNKGGTMSDSRDPGMEDYIPDEWGRGSRQTRVVESGSANNFDFVIKDEPKPKGKDKVKEIDLSKKQ